MSNSKSTRLNNKEGVFKDPYTFIDMHGEHKVFNQEEESKVIMLENDQIPPPQLAEPKVGTRSKSIPSNKKGATAATARSSTTKITAKNSGKVVRTNNQTSGRITTGVTTNSSSNVVNTSNKVDEQFRVPNADGVGTSAWDSESHDSGLDVVINTSSDNLMSGARTLRRALMNTSSSNVDYDARPVIDYLEPEYIEGNSL